MSTDSQAEANAAPEDAETVETNVAPEASVAPETAEAAAPEAEPVDELAMAQAALAVADERYLHLAAEFENYKKRTGRENDDFKKYANESILKEILGVLDNFDRALDHINDADEGIEQLKEGVSLIHKQFNDVLEKFGVKHIPAKGEPFDPNVHQAVSQIENPDVADGHVAEEFRKGFFYKERVLRPSMVVVAKNNGS